MYDVIIYFEMLIYKVGNYLNHLWRFDGQSWTWISGSNSTNQRGVYGIQKVPSALNVPGARHWLVGWMDSKDRLWIFGGEGADASSASGGYKYMVVLHDQAT